MNGCRHALRFFRAQQPAGYASSDGIQEFQPIFQWRIFHRLPAIIAVGSGIKSPAATDAVSVDLAFLAFGCALDLANFGFTYLIYVVSGFGFRVSGCAFDDGETDLSSADNSEPE